RDDHEPRRAPADGGRGRGDRPQRRGAPAGRGMARRARPRGGPADARAQGLRRAAAGVAASRELVRRLVETAALQIDVEEDGPADRRPLLLLHGWPDAPRGWRPVTGRVHERSWRTIVPALRGCGGTRVPFFG